MELEYVQWKYLISFWGVEEKLIGQDGEVSLLPAPTVAGYCEL